jgi:nitrate reductase alpha subunit
MPKGSMGQRWDKKLGNWKLKFEDGESNSVYDPTLTLLNKSDDVLQVEFLEYGLNKKVLEFSLTNRTIHTIIIKPNMKIIIAALMKIGIQVQPLAT